MATNFDKAFESNKNNFRQLFGVEWHTDKGLYLNYVQTLYVQSLFEITNTGLSRIIANQVETEKLLQNISKNTNQ